MKMNQLRLLTEIGVHGKMQHENILAIKDCLLQTSLTDSQGRHHDVTAFVSDYAPNGTLLDLILKGGRRLPEQIVRHYAVQLLDTLRHIHSLNFVHKDVKLENVLLDKDFNLKLTDFGLADKVEGSDASGFEKERFDGTFSYMAPEILLGAPFSGQAADLFAFGVILFALYCGHMPFKIASEQDLCYEKICKRNLKEFWDIHCRDKPEGFFSLDFIDLISNLLSFQPYMRPNLAEIVGHPWF